MGAVGRDQDRLLTGLQALLKRREASLAEEALADRRHRHRRHIEIDERRGWIVRLRMMGALLIASALERRRHVADRQAQALDRSVTDKSGPVGGGLVRRIDLKGG